MRKNTTENQNQTTITEFPTEIKPEEQTPVTDKHVEPTIPATKPVQTKDSLLKKGADKLMELDQKRLNKKAAKEQKKAEKAAAKEAKKAEKNSAGNSKTLKVVGGLAVGSIVLGAIGKAVLDHVSSTAAIQGADYEPLLDDGNTIVEEASVEATEVEPVMDDSNVADLTSNEE